MNRSPLRRRLLLIPLVLVCFALSPTARAVDPPPDGGYPNNNTAEGEDALFSLDTLLGTDNTAIGFDALYNNTTGRFNTASGSKALEFNTIGFSNTATGDVALYNNTTGYQNTATGTEALVSNTTANNNTANGFEALYFNTGNDNTAAGAFALVSTTTGIGNTADGVHALHRNTIGNYNTASGQGALFRNTTGGNNTADGQNARRNTIGSSNIALGSYAGFNLTTGSNNIDIFDRGVVGEANTIRIGTQGTQGTTFIAGISGATVPALKSPACLCVSERGAGRMADAARVLQRLICAWHREAATVSGLLTQSADGIFAACADVAQLVEQRFRKPQVTGSNPVVGCPLFRISDGGLLGRSMLKNRLGHYWAIGRGSARHYG